MMKNKMVMFVLTVGVVVFMLAALTLFSSLKAERDEKIALQNELADVMKERKALSLEAEELRVIKGDLDIKISSLETEKTLIEQEYEYEKSQNDVIRARLDKKDEEIEAIESRLNTALTDKRKIRREFDEEKAKYVEIKQRIDKLMNAKDVLEEKVRDIVNKQGIELERIVVRAEGELEGRVLVVNREYNFIVVNIGHEDDIKLGSMLTVFRAGKYVGEAKVEKIYDTMCAAAISKELKSGAIMINDNVVARTN